MHVPNPAHSTAPPLGRADSLVFILQVLCSIHGYTDMCVSMVLAFPLLSHHPTERKCVQQPSVQAQSQTDQSYPPVRSLS